MLKIQKLSLNTQMTRMIFIQIFIITTKLKRKTEIEVDDMTSNMISTKKFKPIVSELFTGGRTVQ